MSSYVTRACMKHIAFLLLAAAFASCDSGPPPDKAPPPPPPKPTTPAAPATTARPAPEPEKPLSEALQDPSKATEKAPENFKVKFETTKGDFVIDVKRAWAPNGADRFYNLVKIGYFEDIALFRVVEGFVVQFGIHGDKRIAKKWLDSNIAPDPQKESNTKGKLTYAMAGSPDTRSVQLFINYGDNSRLDSQGFAPIGEVVEGMDVVEKFYKGYGERTTREQGAIAEGGNAFLRERYPDLDYIKKASLMDGAGATGSAAPSGAPKTPAPAPAAPKPPTIAK